MNETRQQKRYKKQLKAKAMAREMLHTHYGVPRNERRRVCFQIVKEQPLAENR